MKPSKQQILAFFEKKKIAVAGVSRNSKKFSTVVFQSLKEKGFDVIPINPNVDTIYDTVCYKSVDSLPSDVASLVIVTPKAQTLDLLKQAVSKGIPNIWIQQTSETPETIAYAKTLKQVPVMKQCILMHAEPVTSIHKFHRTIMKIFGALPK